VIHFEVVMNWSTPTASSTQTHVLPRFIAIAAMSVAWGVCFGVVAAWGIGLLGADRWTLVAKTVMYAAALGLLCSPVALLTLRRRSLLAAHVAVFVPMLVFAFFVGPIGAQWGFNLFGAVVVGITAAYIAGLAITWRFLPPRRASVRGVLIGSARALVVMLLAAALAAGVGYWWLSRLYYSGVPTITRDYLSDLNAPIRAIPEGDRAWPMYMEAFRDCNVLSLPYFNESDWYLGATREEAAIWLEQHAGAVERMRVAAAKPALGRALAYEYDDELQVLRGPRRLLDRAESGDGRMGVLDVTVEYAGPMRAVAQTLASDARMAREQGDAARFVADIKAILGVANHVRESGFLIGDLVSLSCIDSALDEVGACLHEQAALLSDEDLTRMAEAIERFERSADPIIRLDAETIMIDDLLQRAFTDDSDGDGRITPAGWAMMADLPFRPDDAPELPAWLVKLAEPLRLLDAASRRSQKERHRAMIEFLAEDAAKPYWERSTEFDSEVRLGSKGPWDDERHRIVLALTPALQRALRNGEEITLRLGAMLGAIACERHRRATGQWPRTWAEVSPALLDRELFDPMDGAPLRIAVLNGELRIYSVGHDLIDDGGEWARGADGSLGTWPLLVWPRGKLMALRAEGSSSIGQGDFVLFPPPPELLTSGSPRPLAHSTTGSRTTPSRRATARNPPARTGSAGNGRSRSSCCRRAPCRRGDDRRPGS